MWVGSGYFVRGTRTNLGHVCIWGKDRERELQNKRLIIVGANLSHRRAYVNCATSVLGLNGCVTLRTYE